MSLISIAQRETFHISFVQFNNKGYETDNLTLGLKRKEISRTIVSGQSSVSQFCPDIVKYWKGMWHIKVKNKI